MAVRRSPKPLVGVRFPPSEPIWAGSDNGSTGALQAFSRSSILRRSTKFWSLRLSVRIAACHAAETGSTPVGTANQLGYGVMVTQ